MEAAAKVAELQKEGMLETEARASAELTQTEINFLMKYQHYQEHEAEEAALKLFILLPPEPEMEETRPRKARKKKPA